MGLLVVVVVVVVVLTLVVRMIPGIIQIPPGLIICIIYLVPATTVCDGGAYQIPPDEFRMPISRRPVDSKRRATRLWKDLDDIFPKPPPLLFVPRWFRRKPAQHFIPGILLSYMVSTSWWVSRLQPDTHVRGSKGVVGVNCNKIVELTADDLEFFF